MKEDNIIREKSYKFAIRAINLYKYLNYEKREYVISKQALRSGTSIGANIEEAIGACSKNDFISKMAIAYKEARQTKYWLNLLKDTGFIKKEFIDSILLDCEEICKILGKIIITSKENRNS